MCDREDNKSQLQMYTCLSQDDNHLVHLTRVIFSWPSHLRINTAGVVCFFIEEDILSSTGAMLEPYKYKKLFKIVNTSMEPYY